MAHGRHAAAVQPPDWNLDFGTENGEVVVLVQLASPKGETTKVNIMAVKASVLKELRNRNEKSALEKAPPVPPPAPKELLAADVPLPKDAKNVKRERASEEITFRVATDVAGLTAQLRSQLTAAGWREEKTFAAVSKVGGLLVFKQEQATLRIVLVNTGLGDGTQATISTTGLRW